MFPTDKGQKSVCKIVCKDSFKPSSGSLLKRDQPCKLYRKGVHVAFIKAACPLVKNAL